MGVWTGTVPNLAVTLHAVTSTELGVLHDIAVALTDPYTSYTPTWTGGTTAIGNGTLSGAYRQVGHAVDGWIAIIGGSTTNWGGGTAWTIGLPVNSNEGTGSPIGVAQAAVSSAAARFGGHAWQNGAASIALAKEDSTRWSSTVPLAFVSGSEIRVWFHYEAA